MVNCTGMWARQMAQHQAATRWKLGPEVVVPNQAAEHYYLVTDSIPEVDPDWPVIEDPSSYTYIRPEGGGLMIGLFEVWRRPGVRTRFLPTSPLARSSHQLGSHVSLCDESHGTSAC